MRAVAIGPGGTLGIVDRPVPEPGADEVLVRVRAAGLNRADLLQRAGRYPAPPDVPADVPGLELAGEVAAVGPEVVRWAPGDRVMAVVGGGGQAEYALVPEAHCVAVPDGLDPVAAGGVPEAFVTAHDALRTRGRLVDGERVLVHAVGSGVGTAALQLATAWGCPVVGTARTATKLDRATGLGLDHAVLAPAELDPEALAAAVVAQGGPVDVTVDLVGGRYVQADVLAAAVKGRIVLVGALAGARAELSVVTVMGKRLTVVGTVLRSRSAAEKAEATAAFAAEVLPLLADGTVAPVVEAVVPMVEVERAYELLASDATFGKVILAT
ncbi:MAG: zinc-binding dehydrogenase [Acidimicrobiia bacterium]|nr:zinc-binding dehydrogenase [Acidimicrobiia bacterium]